ncbi:alpha/beta fold hydrolase [bacterium]|nr:alpha/beta fold hydrolase [bacterium]
MLRKMLVGTTFLCLLSYLSICLLVSRYQTSLTLFPRVGLSRTPKDVGLAFEEWRLPSGSGTVVAWKVTPPKGTRGWLLHCHGNGGNIDGRLELAVELARRGIGVVLFDYRGYGESQGVISCQQDLYQDAQAVYDRLAQSKQPIWIYGESLGGGVASYLAEKNSCQGLVLQSTFTSFNQRAAESYPFLPIGWLSRFQMDTRSRLAGLKCPVLVIHGRQDEVIGFHHGQQLFAAAHEPKRWAEVDGGHNLPEDFLARVVAEWMAGVS